MISPARPPAPVAAPLRSEAVAEPEPNAVAIPVTGLAAGSTGAQALEQLLQRIDGVTSAYVSPVTALAYVNFFPERVSEAGLVEAILNGGFGAGPNAQRFDWRHSNGIEPLSAMSTTAATPPAPEG